LTIAKELYTHGYVHSKNKNPSDTILSILNFDYCVETIVKAVLLDRKISLMDKHYPKSFNKLIEELKTLYPDLGYTSEVLSLHKLRNDTQHLGLIPSTEEVERHKITARSFFDEICQKVYEGNITFADVSLALFVISETEKMILSEMEKALQGENFSLSVYYAKHVIGYHVNLLRENMKVPYSWHSAHLSTSLSGKIFGDLGRFVRDTDEKLDWLIDRLCLGEYYDEVYEILGPSEFGHPSMIEIGDADRETAERARNITYDFVTRTQGLVKEVKKPMVFDLRVMEKDESKCFVQIGIASDYKIVEAKIVLIDVIPGPVIEILPQIGFQMVKIENLKKGSSCTIQAVVANEKEGEARKYLSFKM
jgi:hypothetical protein